MRSQEQLFEIQKFKAMLSVKEQKIKDLQKEVSTLNYKFKIQQNATLNYQSVQHQTNMSQTYMSIPQERKSNVIQNLNKLNVNYVKNGQKQNYAQRASSKIDLWINLSL